MGENMGLDIFGNEVTENTPPEHLKLEFTLFDKIWEYRFGIAMFILAVVLICITITAL